MGFLHSEEKVILFSTMHYNDVIDEITGELWKPDIKIF